MRVCLVYDHVFPATVGGGERWMRDLAARLARRGPRGDVPDDAALGRRRARRARRRPHRGADAPPGASTRRAADARPAAALRARGRCGTSGGTGGSTTSSTRPRSRTSRARGRRLRAGAGGYALVVDWFEVWTRDYWRRYAGLLAGTVGWLVQRRASPCAHRAQLHLAPPCAPARRARATAARRPSSPGSTPGRSRRSAAGAVDPDLVVYAGRHVREKRLDALVRGVRGARGRRRERSACESSATAPTGRGCERSSRDARPRRRGRAPGRVPEDEVARDDCARAACVATASEREGYGLVVVEAAAKGTPASSSPVPRTPPSSSSRRA